MVFAGAYKFLNNLPINSEVKFGEGGYQFIDVHSSHALLNLEDENFDERHYNYSVCLLSPVSYVS